jgi:formamidopyrimidine-DNA glycosylase
MPELPEVQTVVNDLKDAIVGFTIVNFCSLWEKNIGCGLIEFKRKILGKKISAVKRRGKFILLELHDKSFIVLHLRMTGQLLVKKNITGLLDFEEKKRKHIRHWWILGKDDFKIGLFFHDVRKFATVDWTDNPRKYKSFLGQGLEPLSEYFTQERLAELLKASKRTIRSVLLDQKMILGIGNIYVSEILFVAGIYPGRITDSLSGKEIEKLYRAILAVLSKAIALRGTTFSDYRDSQGKIGGFQNVLTVYNRKDKGCRKKNCAGKIQKETLGQRSSFWCPICQKQ